MPGIPNPLRLPIDEFNGYLMAIIDKFDDQSKQTGNVDHRAYVEREMRKAKRV